MTSSPASARPLRIAVDLAAIGSNFHAIQRYLKRRAMERVVCAVVKADAYGHGMLPVARALRDAGAGWLGVSSLEEAVSLREAGVQGRILCLGTAFEGEAEGAWDLFRRHELTPTLYAPRQAESFLRWRARTGPWRFHLKINTGMNRLGFAWQDARESLPELPWEDVEGVFTHFARADESDPEPTRVQIQRFQEILPGIRKRAGNLLQVHVSNSAGMSLEEPGQPFTMVRPGLALYGYSPGPGREDMGLIPAMSIDADLVHVFDAQPGERVGYGGDGIVRSPTRIGILPVGYGDGLARAIWSRGMFSHPLGPCPILGRISMDLTAVALPPGAKAGDTVRIMGPDGPTAADLAGWEGTIAYEVLCRFGRRGEVYHHGKYAETVLTRPEKAR